MNATLKTAALRGSTALGSGQVGDKTPKPVVFVQKQLLDIAKQAITMHGVKKVYNTVYRIEDMPPENFAEYPVAGTPFEPIANAFNSHGVPTEMTLGGVMKSMHPDLEPDQQQHMAHAYICYCIEDSKVMTGGQMVDRIETNNAQ